jgi:hypothetical protein
MNPVIDLWNMDLLSLTKLIPKSMIEIMDKVKGKYDYMKELQIQTLKLKE